MILSSVTLSDRLFNTSVCIIFVNIKLIGCLYSTPQCILLERSTVVRSLQNVSLRTLSGNDTYLYRVAHLVEDNLLLTLQYDLRLNITSLYFDRTYNLISTNCFPRPDWPPCTSICCWSFHYQRRIFPLERALSLAFVGVSAMIDKLAYIWPYGPLPPSQPWQKLSSTKLLSG